MAISVKWSSKTGRVRHREPQDLWRSLGVLDAPLAMGRQRVVDRTGSGRRWEHRGGHRRVKHVEMGLYIYIYIMYIYIYMI